MLRRTTSGMKLKSHRSYSYKLILWLLAGVFVLLSLHLVFQYLNFVVYGEKHGQIFEISNRVDMDDEVSLPTWFSQFVLLLIGAVGWFLAWLESDRLKKVIWSSIGFAGVLFSIDEVSSLHEFVLQSIHLIFYGEAPPSSALNAWWFVLPFVAIVAGILGFIAIKKLPVNIWMLMITGGVIYIIGGGGVDLISNDYAKNTFLYQGILTGLEETLELTGSLLILYASLRYLEISHKTKINIAIKALIGK